MRRDRDSRSLFTAGLVGFAAGALLGLLGAQLLASPSPRAAVAGGPAPASDDGDRLDELTAALGRMQEAVEAMRADLALRTAPAARPEPVTRPVREVSPTPASSERVVVPPREDAPRWVAELQDDLGSISARIDDLEAIQHLAVELLRRVPDAVGYAASFDELPPIPPETSVRAYMEVLKSGDIDTARVHSLWTEQQVLARYGNPDEIATHDDYVEWIYRLGEEEQFDFHFVNGLCVEAH